MLAVKDLSFRRPGGFALKLDDWQAGPGKVHAVLGTNGAGKSTLLRLLSGEQRSHRQVWLHGRPLEQWPARARACHLGVLPQASHLSFNFNAQEVVALGLTPLALGWRDAQQAVAAVMRATDCAHLARSPYPNLSGGERQRVHLARVLVQLSQAEREPVLLLDEPTSAQDLGQQHRMLALARSLARSHHYTVVTILHDLNLALRYTDHALLLAGGESVTQGTPAEVVTGDRIKRHWGYDASLLASAQGYPVVV